MFKLENYITPLLLSYVDKYIKNFRPEDSQVSLWGGDVSFHNLDLRLEVLEQELQLPFSFVSGHIHELLIHVPWTKLASEPITITINTIECILKLRNQENGGNSDASGPSKDQQKKAPNKRQEVEAPPGYIQSLINKIVSNIKINCNNLILKYVEEDIVVSMNVKLLTFESANEKWESAYIDISSPHVILRKLISVLDLTICLDKRNAAGKIDVYQEPVLYRCSLSMHMLRQYHSASAKRSSTTRLDVYCSSMEFSMTEQQVPMLFRIGMLLLALQQRQLRPDVDVNLETLSTPTDIAEILEVPESWAGWAWSFVPSILPLSWDQDWNDGQQMATSGHTVRFGFYVDYASLTFKVSESSSSDRGYYSQRKMKYLPVLTLRLQGIFMESVTHGTKWFHCQSGISQAVLLPVGQCTCSHPEIPEGVVPAEYLKGGLISMAHKHDSLFDVEAPENKGQNKVYNMSWDFHMLTVTEGSLLERTPAFATDFLYQLEVPDDMSSERLSELGSDLEYSNLHERSLLRVVVGPLRLRMCSGFFHRLNSLRMAASAYDYSPYSVPKSDPPLSELQPSCAEDFDALSDNIPSRAVQIALIGPIVEIQMMDHPHFEPTKRSLYRKYKKHPTSSSSPGIPTNSRVELPKITLECSCIDMKLQYPMYIKRLVQTVCQLPEPPQNMFDACHTVKTIKIMGFCSHLITLNKRQTTIIPPCSAAYNCRIILKPQYWIDPDIPHQEVTLESENLTVTGTKAKLMLVCQILDRLIRMDGLDALYSLSNNTLLRDASRSFGMAYLEISLENIRFKKVTTNSTTTIDSSLGSIKAFVYEPILQQGSFLRRAESTLTIGSNISNFSGRLNSSIYSVRDIQQVLFISGPEPSHETETEKEIKKNTEFEKFVAAPALFTASIQFPLNPDHQPHPPIFIFSIQETRICIDPLLCRWMLYTPRPVKKADFFDPQQRKNRNISEASGSIMETPRRAGTPHESIHSSSDRDHIFIPPPIQKLAKESDALDLQEKVYNFLKRWFSVWKSMLLNGEISPCTIYFPVESLSAVGSQGIQQALQEALGKPQPPEIFVVTLPYTTIYSASQRRGLSKCLAHLPIKLPQAVWSGNKSGFPWIISVLDMSCYTLQNGKKLNVLKQFTLTATIGVSTKSNTSDTRLPKSDVTGSSSRDVTNTSIKQIRNSDGIITSDTTSHYYDTQSDIASLGICVHVDMTSITISISQVQVCLIASILYGLTVVVKSLLPEKSKENPKSPEVVQSVLGWSSTVSPTLMRESTLDSVSEQTPPIPTVAGKIESDSVKLTAFIQWTIARFKIQLLSHDKDLVTDDVSYLYHPNLKLVLDAEDIVCSVDFQSVFLKFKSKVAAANIHHFKRKKGSTVWKPGQFLGLVMKVKEEVSTGERQEDIGFASITITRASCQHTHALWGAVHKNKLKEGKINAGNTIHFIHPSHYITEILLTTQQIDFVIPMSTLRSFYSVLEPLMEESEEVEPEDPVRRHWLLQISNQDLPLIYVECQGLRVTIPSVELGGTGAEHDVCMFQIDSINLTPTAVNPICRTPCRPDIYQLAAQSRILNIPGSEVEDRQYQLDIAGMCANTGIWEDLDTVLNLQGSFSTLRTMSENPALEWNNLEQGRLSISKHLSFWPVVSKFDLSIVVAPAMIYKTNTLVCGHSIELNCVSDVEINLSLSQIQLASALLTELFHIFEPFLLFQEVAKRPRIRFPYPRFDHTQLDMEEDETTDSVDVARDSGIDTSDLPSIFSSKTKESTMDVSQVDMGKRVGVYGDSEKSYSTFPRPPNPLPPGYHNIPVDLLLTGGKIILALYQLNRLRGKAQSKQKDKKHKPILKDSNYDKGYEASEEGSIDEKYNLSLGIKQFQPLLFVAVSQPNIFVSRYYLGRKVQLSCFDVCVKISGPEYVPLKAIPTEDDYPINLLETKSGMPNPGTGIPPAFFVLKWSRGIGKPANVDVEIARPTKILCSVTRWNYLIIIKDKVMDCFKSSFESLVYDGNVKLPTVSNKEKHYGTYSGSHKTTENYTKFKEIKNKFYRTSSLNVKLAQVVLVFKTDNVPQVNVSISKLKNNLTLSNRPERLVNVVTLESLTVGVLKDGVTRLLLNPWTFTVETSLFWESWQCVDSDPQIQISMESDCIVVDISPEQIKCLEVVVKDITEFVSSLSYEDSFPQPSASLHDSSKAPALDKDQYYKDDLRAGAFQLVNATNNSSDELPLPYQVMFWNKTISAMAWRYPQPRALTKVRVFPVPFKNSDNQAQSDYQVLCHLEYWSECHGCYRPYMQFHLSESEMIQLTLPERSIQPVACTWRVLLSLQYDESQIYDFDCSRILISPRALAACMRVDSYFNKALVPDLTVALDLSTVNISLHSNLNKAIPIAMPDSLKQYTCDLLFPETQCFLSLTLDGTRAYLATWNFDAVAFDVTTTTKCSVLDYGFLTQQTLLEPFSAKVEVDIATHININVMTKPINVKFGPSIAHTLAVSSQMWEQSWKSKISTDDSRNLIIMTRYVICNNTNINLRFGQTSTDEDILLLPHYCHLYCWRSQKTKQMIRVGLEENGWIWSHSFQIDVEGVETVKVSSEGNVVLVITVKKLSATQKQITFSGQLILCNMLLEHFELKVVPIVKDDKDKEFKRAPSHIIPGKSTPPSLLIDVNKQYHLRLRFFGLESAWSGDIPLMENTKCAQPWLVKVPLQERGQFLSIWCRIITQPLSSCTQILAILWPLFMVRSNLPVSAKVQIETPTLNVQLESTVHGKGEYQQLYCPGTIDHSHQLSFQLDGGSPTSNPYVPLNYSLVDQKQFFKRPDKESIDETLQVVTTFDKSSWPYFGEDMEGIEWVSEDQPLTHVQVRYQNACQYSSALLVELLPWSLMVNILGCPIAIIVNERELCRICHHGIVTPPKLEDTFHIGVGINGTWNVSLPLQLAKSEWSQAFYMPKITGTIPLEGSIQTAVVCNKNICMVSITSNIVNEIRLLKICSSHVLTNYIPLQLQVVCFAVPDTEKVNEIPKDLEKHSFSIAPGLNKSNTGISIVQWFVVGKEVDANANFALYISVAVNSKFGWSCPVRVDKAMPRRSIAVHSESQYLPMVIVTQEYKGQTYLSLHKDLHPQILIENSSRTKLFFAQASGDENNIVSDCQHFKWTCGIDNKKISYYTMPGYSEKFPDLSQNSFSENLVIACDPQGDSRGFQWSSPIDISNYSDQFVRVPFFGDVKIAIIYAVHTTFITIESASQVEISAKDIRVRLFMHENEAAGSTSKQELGDTTDEFTSTTATDSNTTVRTYYSAEDVTVPSLDTTIAPPIKSVPSTSQAMPRSTAHRFQTLPTLQEKSNIFDESFLRRVLSENASDLGITNSLLTSPMPIKEGCKFSKFASFIKGVTLTLISDLNNSTYESGEIASIICDDIVFIAEQTDVIEATLSMSEIQFDNQMYSRGGFDFPVVLISQHVKVREELASLNSSVMHLIKSAQKNPVVRVDLLLETWQDPTHNESHTEIRDVKIGIVPLCAYIEDNYITRLMDYLSVFAPTKLVLWPTSKRKINYSLNSIVVGVPDHVTWEAAVTARPLILRSLSVEPLSLLLSVHSSIKLYIALDQSPLQFGQFDRTRIITTPYRMGHALTMHYLSGAIFGAGWVVGSLELLGSPGGLARAMGTGLRDFVSLPYQGLIQGPWAFLRGVTHGSASLMRHVTAGTLQSVTKLASSVARNLDRLTLDEEHLKRTEEQRRQRPQGLAQGFLQGLTGLGISLLGAVGGIAHHPIQSVMMEGASPRGLAAGVGLGLVGVITKPLSGAADLVALTGQGLLQGAGWNPLPEPRTMPAMHHVFSHSNSVLKYNWKFMQSVTHSSLLFVTDATWITNNGEYEGVALVLTTEALIMINTDEDISVRVVSLSELSGVDNASDPTLLNLKLTPVITLEKNQDECIIEMDPACRARVADYVRSTVGLLRFPDDLSPEPSEMSVSPCPTPASVIGPVLEQTVLSFYVNPQSRNYFLTVLSLAKQQHQNYNFPVL